MPKLAKLLAVLALTGLIAAAGARDAPATTPSPADAFAQHAPSPPASWELLLAALLTVGVIARRRLSRH